MSNRSVSSDTVLKAQRQTEFLNSSIWYTLKIIGFTVTAQLPLHVTLQTATVQLTRLDITCSNKTGEKCFVPLDIEPSTNICALSLLTVYGRTM